MEKKNPVNGAVAIALMNLDLDLKDIICRVVDDCQPEIQASDELMAEIKTTIQEGITAVTNTKELIFIQELERVKNLVNRLEVQE